MKFNNMNKKQKGFVSSEVGIAIFVIGLLGLGGFLSAQFLVKDGNASILVTNTVDTLKNIRTKYRHSGDFTGLTSTQVITLNAAPRTMVNGDSTLINNYGGTLAVTPTNCSGSNDCIQFVQSRLPEDACVDYVNGVFDVSDTISVGSTEVKGSGVNTINQATLGTACDNASNNITSTHTRA
ncbi:type 4 pilus major pilin [Kistimonas asteriae]|uniref:type 4 pilus major pilin n=1 Tax=Kistimonas asteriae TaxID=517724 RepID=UPI001BAD1333|nr:type 4 pilus major pilin [Kistimonas asteriae]